MFLVFSVTINRHVCSLTRRVKRNVVSCSDSKRAAIVQMHDERLPGMFKLQESLCNRHGDTRIMGEFALADQRRCTECSTDFAPVAPYLPPITNQPFDALDACSGQAFHVSGLSMPPSPADQPAGEGPSSFLIWLQVALIPLKRFQPEQGHFS